MKKPGKGGKSPESGAGGEPPPQDPGEGEKKPVTDPAKPVWDAEERLRNLPPPKEARPPAPAAESAPGAPAPEAVPPAPDPLPPDPAAEGRKRVRDAVQNATPAPRVAPKAPPATPPAAGAQSAPNVVPIGKGKKAEGKAGQPGAPRAGVGPQPRPGPLKDCPITPLGIAGDHLYFLDASKQLRRVKDKDMGRAKLMSLLGSQVYWAYERFGVKNTDGDVIRWKPEKLAEELSQAAHRRGPWDPSNRERARGAWRGADDELVLHLGDVVLVRPRDDAELGESGPWRELDPGLIGRYVYPAGPALNRPSDVPQPSGEHGPAQKLLTLLGSWSWRRPRVDPVLLLGWIGAAMIGGALDWRSMAWYTGGSGTGKSTLQKLITGLFEDALLACSDASAAGVWQTAGRASLPIALDEAEAKQDNRKIQAVIELARQAASGGKILRGGADHEGTEFTVRSAFLFSSILVPPLDPQDRNRLAILELAALKAGAKPPVLEQRAMRLLGAQLLRRMLDAWPRLPAVLQVWREALIERGHTARSADQLGTLLACADVLLADGEPLAEDVARLADPLAPGVAEEESRDERKCLAHLLSAPIDPLEAGRRKTVAEWIEVAAGYGPEDRPAELGNRILAAVGLKVGKDAAGEYLAVANEHQGVLRIFTGTHWASRSGTQGVWVQALRRLPGASALEQPIWLAGMTRCSRIPLALVIEEPRGAPGAGPGAGLAASLRP